MICAEEKEAVYRQFHKKVSGYVAQKVGHAQEAEDIVSEIFLKVYEKLDTFDETKASLSTWIYTIARNAVIDHYRTHKPSEPLPETLATGEDMEQALIQADSLEMLSRALEKLETRQRDIVILRYYKGLSMKEIVQRLGISYSYGKLLHQSALNQLRKQMER